LKIFGYQPPQSPTPSLSNWSTAQKATFALAVAALLVSSSLVALNISSTQPITPYWQIYQDPNFNSNGLYDAKAPNGTILFSSTNASDVGAKVFAKLPMTVQGVESLVEMTGTIDTSSQILVPSGIDFEGINCCIYSSSPDYVINTPTDGQYITIDGFTIRESSTGVCVNINATTPVGGYYVNDQFITVNNVNTQYGTNGLATFARRVTVTNSKFYYASSSGVILGQGTTDDSFSLCTFAQNGGFGASVPSEAEPDSWSGFYNCITQSNVQGGYNISEPQVTIDGNGRSYVESNGNFGILVNPTGEVNVENSLVFTTTGSGVGNSGGIGICFNSSSGNTVSNCIISDETTGWQTIPVYENGTSSNNIYTYDTSAGGNSIYVPNNGDYFNNPTGGIGFPSVATTTMGNSTIFASSNSGYVGQMLLGYYVVPTTGFITQLSAYCSVTEGSANVGLSVYTSGVGSGYQNTQPDRILANSSTAITSTAQWNNVTVALPVVKGEVLWLGMQFLSGSTGTMTYYYTNYNSWPEILCYTSGSANFPTVIGTPAGFQDWQTSEFATIVADS
jgi:hypothetical protein